MITVTRAALNAYRDWAHEAHSWSMTIPEYQYVTGHPFVWDATDIPQEVFRAPLFGLSAEIRRPYLQKSGKTTYRTYRASAWTEDRRLILGDYPRPGDVVTIRW